MNITRRHYGLVCRLRRHARGAPDMKAYAVAGVVIDFCNTCSRDSLATLDLDAIRNRREAVMDDTPDFFTPSDEHKKRAEAQLERVREAIERLKADHPFSYGFRVAGETDEPVFDPAPDDKTIGERYARCPRCDQWSPCDVRELIAYAEGVTL